MRLSEDATLKFVNLYVENDCLWNIGSDGYKNKNVKSAAYEKMVREMAIEGFGVEEVKQKIKNLRSTYSQELCKIAKSRNVATGEVYYVPSLKWFNIMHSFIKNVRTRKITKSNLVPQLTDSIDDAMQLIKLEEEMQIDDNDERSSTNIESNFDIIDDDWQINNGNNSLHPEESASFREERGKRRHLQQHSSSLEEFQHTAKRHHLEVEEHECDVFGRYTALILKKLPLEQSILAQEEIHAILTRQRRLSTNLLPPTSLTTP